MTKEQLFKILDDNGVKYDKTIEHESTEGYVSDECAALADKIYGDLYRMALYGVNYGFSKCEDDIKELIKLISSMIAGTSRKVVNLAKTDKKRVQIVNDAKYLKKEIDMDILNQLTGNLNDCISAADAIMTIRKDNETLCQKLADSKAALEEMKEVLSHVVDAQSKNAAEYQVKIFEALMDWREAVSRYNCYSDTVDGLKRALDVAKEWQKLSATVRKNAKRGVDYYEYKEDCDDVGFIIHAAKFAERTDGMREHLNDFRNQTTLLYSVEALQGELARVQNEYLSERDRINARLAEIKTETDSVLFSYQNGETDAVEADMKVADLEDEEADLNEQLKNLQEDYNYESQDLKLQLRDAQGGSRVRDKIAKNFEDFVKKIEAYRNTDPAMFVILCERIDFNGVYDTLTGRLSDKDIDEVYVSVETVIREAEEDIRRQRRNLSGFNKINDRMRENRRHEEKILREQEEARRQRLQNQTGTVRGAGGGEDEAKKRLESRLARRAGGTAPSAEDKNTTAPFNIRNDDK
ncbi:MAG: hypothetical protein NC033_02460 [Clostridiales bacterium]|nr:hypothetical protein [Clostridiales bacterium]